MLQVDATVEHADDDGLQRGGLRRRQATGTVVATQESVVYRMTRPAFDQLRAAEPGIACALLMDIARALSQRARAMQMKANQ